MNGICSHCGKRGPIVVKEKGWISSCYYRWYRAGRPDTGPPPPRRRRRAPVRRVRKPAVLYSTCDSCGQEKEHNRQRWCPACRNRWNRAGRPASGPPPRTTGRWEEYAELTREQGYTLANAAARMGVSYRTAQRYEAWLREAGVPASTYESGRFGVLVTRPFSAQYGQEVA